MRNFYYCLLSISFILFSNLSYSQVSFAVKSGINIATVKDINSDPKNRVGWYAGGVANIPLHKKFFLEPELLFSAKGYSGFANLNDTKKTPVRLNYITAPILVGYKIDNKTTLFVGPEIGYLVSVYYETPYNETFNVSNNFPVKLDIELDIGLKYEIVKNAGIEIRYTYGFKNMYITDAVGVRIGEALAGNRVFQIGGFYSFPFSSKKTKK